MSAAELYAELYDYDTLEAAYGAAFLYPELCQIIDDLTLN